MITLKPYQERVLDSLRDFFCQCAQDCRPEAAFQAVQFGNGSSSPVPYIPVNAVGLSPGMPYVCLRRADGRRQNAARVLRRRVGDGSTHARRARSRRVVGVAQRRALPVRPADRE